jgi:hypothetical protein
MKKLSFSLPKYDFAMSEFYNRIADNLHMQDELLRRFPPVRVTHTGTTRLLSKPDILEEPYKLHKNITSGEIEIITQTNIVKFKDFLLDLIIPIQTKLKEDTEEIINQTCNVTGNKIDAKNQNVWDAYIEALEKMKVSFDDDGNPNFLVHPPEFYEKLSKTTPTIEQGRKVEEIFRRKKEEWFSKKQSRRLLKSTRKPMFSSLNEKIDINTLKSPLKLPKYELATIQLIRDVKKGFENLDDILGKIKSVPVAHGGKTRQVSEPQILETPMRRYSAVISVKFDTFYNTDIEEFRDALCKFIEEAIGQMREHFFSVFPQICDATGNSINAQGKNVWDAHLEMLETIEMHFDENGNHHTEIIMGSDIEKIIKDNPPTPEQIARENEIIERKKKEYYAQKRTRRLS